MDCSRSARNKGVAAIFGDAGLSPPGLVAPKTAKVDCFESAHVICLLEFHHQFFDPREHTARLSPIDINRSVELAIPQT